MCWICESWIEANINIDLNNLMTPYDKPEKPNDPLKVYVHFDFDDYQPDLMIDLHLNNRPEKLGKFQIYRLLPQTTVLFFFSIDGVPFTNTSLTSVAID